jgi:hypothetical protein
MRSRSERLALVLLHRAAAEALEARLKREAIDLFEQEQSADTWKLPDGQVITATTHDRQSVSDRDALLDYLERHTGAVQTVTTREVSDAFLKPFLAGLIPYVVREGKEARRATAQERRQPGATFPVMDTEGREVPGVQWTAGGLLYGVSLKPDPKRTERLAFVVGDYADGDCTFEEMVQDADTDDEAVAADEPHRPPLEIPVIHVQRGGIRYQAPLEG